MRTLSLREYQQIHKGEAFDPEQRIVTASQFERLEAISSNYEDRFNSSIFKFGPKGCLVAQNYVGVISIGDSAIEILPKIEGLNEDSNAPQVRHNLAKMLVTALDIAVLEGDIANMAKQGTVLEVLIRLFCKYLWNALRQGMVRRYEPYEDDLVVLRGRLDIARQLRANSAKSHILSCRFDEFTEDTPINQIFKAALRLLVRLAGSYETQRLSAELLNCFQEVADVHRSFLPWHRVKTDRLTDRFEPLLKLARMFIENTPPDVTAGTSVGFALLFDMNKLFEEYVGRMCQRVFMKDSIRVTLQGPSEYLVQRDRANMVFGLRPDVVAREGQNYSWILDTKWKRLDGEISKEGVSQSDMYQMYAYAKRYDVAKVVLLYPHHFDLGETPGIRSSYLLVGQSDMAQRIHIATLDLRDLSTTPDQLGQIFSDTPMELVA